MRLTDLLHPHLDGVTTVVDATPGGLRLEPYLHLPDGVTLCRDERVVGEGELVLMVTGPDPALHGSEDHCAAVLERMRTGGRGVLLFGHLGAELPYHRVLDHLVRHNCQVLRAAPLDYTHLRAGAVFARTGELLPLHDWFGRPVATDDGLRTALRTAGEYVFSDLVSRSLRARVLDLERTAEEAVRARDAAREDGLTDRLAAAVREKEQAAAALRTARERNGVLESRVAMLEGSTSLQVGRALVSAARSPRRGAVRLPGELYGLWRARRSTAHRGVRTAAEQPAALSAPVGSAVADDRLHLAHRALLSAPRDRLAIVGVLTDRTADDFASAAVVNRPLPHDGRLLVARTDPDAVVVQLSACTGHGPWSLTGTNLAPDLDRALAELLAEARASGRKTVLWQDIPETATAPGLTRYTWDAVLDTNAGVRLARLDPAETGRERLREVFLHDSTRVRLAPLARLTGAPDPLDARRVAVLAAPRDRHDRARLTAQVLGQLHRPAEVVVPDPEGLDELTGAGIAVRTGTPTAPWVADWRDDPTEDRPGTLLLDLMCAQEYSDADALGASDADDDYVFVPGLRPLLVSRALHLAGAPPGSWSARGHRLFAVRTKESA